MSLKCVSVCSCHGLGLVPVAHDGLGRQVDFVAPFGVSNRGQSGGSMVLDHKSTQDDWESDRGVELWLRLDQFPQMTPSCVPSLGMWPYEESLRSPKAEPDHDMPLRVKSEPASSWRTSSVANGNEPCPPCLGTTTKVVTWLILPVVICLSQRLSHACLSISNYTAKLRMAH